MIPHSSTSVTETESHLLLFLTISVSFLLDGKTCSSVMHDKRSGYRSTFCPHNQYERYYILPSSATAFSLLKGAKQLATLKFSSLYWQSLSSSFESL